MRKAEIKTFLDEKYYQYNQHGFIESDPVCIPHGFSKKQDIEIAGLFAATLAWGQRKTIISKCRELLNRMDNDPHAFIRDHKEKDLIRFQGFKHRTFNDTDTLYFVHFLKWYYHRHESLEEAFPVNEKDTTIEQALVHFHTLFFSLPDYPQRTRKHLSTPLRKSTCKRLCMFLRWMVRQDDHDVDFGLWKKISPSKLVCPCDVHVERVARSLTLIRRKQTDWQTALELTKNLRKLDPTDPVKYDFALFGLGIVEGWSKGN